MDEQNPHQQAVCARCGAAIDPADHSLVRGQNSDQAAYFCRTEHIVGWVLRGANWPVERPWELDPSLRSARSTLTLKRVRAGVETAREFRDAGALKDWALAGGLWGESTPS